MQRIFLSIFSFLFLLLSATFFNFNIAWAQSCLAQQQHSKIRTKLGQQCAHNDKRFNCIEINRVIDGDTLSINIFDVHPYFGKDTAVRLYGLDTPESRPPTVKCLALSNDSTNLDQEEYEICQQAQKLRNCEIAASKKATEVLEQAICKDSDRIDVALIKNSKGELLKEKYGRVLGDVYIVKYKGKVAQTTNAKELLLGKKLAFHYNGGTKVTRNWCDTTLITNVKLQSSYVKENFCSSRKCTEKTLQKRCFHRTTYDGQIACYKTRIDENITRWFSSCKSKSGIDRRNCYEEKSANYLQFCRQFDTQSDFRSCRQEITEVIENYCFQLPSSASKDCSAII